MNGEFKCLKCEHEFKDKPGPHVSCKKCGHVYVKWVNYEEMKNLRFK